MSDAFDFHEVADFAFVKDYVLTVRFVDGVERTIDFEPILLGPLFGPLRDLHLFRQARVDQDLGTIVWPTGADIDPGVLYDWPEHVDAIVQRRKQRFAVETPVLQSVSQKDATFHHPGYARQRAAGRHRAARPTGQP